MTPQPNEICYRLTPALSRRCPRKRSLPSEPLGPPLPRMERTAGAKAGRTVALADSSGEAKSTACRESSSGGTRARSGPACGVVQEAGPRPIRRALSLRYGRPQRHLNPMEWNGKAHGSAGHVRGVGYCRGLPLLPQERLTYHLDRDAEANHASRQRRR